MIEIDRVRVDPAKVDRLLDIHDRPEPVDPERLAPSPDVPASEVHALLADELGHDRGELVTAPAPPWCARGAFIVSSFLAAWVRGRIRPSERRGCGMAVETREGAELPVEGIAVRAGRVDREARFPSESVAALAAAGALGLAVPERFGGVGAGPVAVCEAIERVSAACASTGMVFAMHVVAMQTLAAGVAADEPDGPKHAALAAAARGEHLSTLAYSEHGSRGHFWAQVSRARAADGGVVIDADKSFATSAGEADSYVLACGAPGSDDPLTTDLYLVAGDAPGIEIAAPFDGLGMRANASAPLRVRSLHVTADRRLGETGGGFGLMMQATLPWFVLGSAACSVGIAGAALDAAIAHATGTRLEHLGSSLADIPGVRARLAKAKVRHAQARAYLYDVAVSIEHGAPDAMIGVLALKAAAAEMAVEVTDLCLRVGGGAAYAKHGPLERHFRDARAASVMAPTTDLLHDFLGKALCGQELF
jgi:alkylation response protein AidB-like acyl-CoA dehydrogenase